MFRVVRVGIKTETLVEPSSRVVFQNLEGELGAVAGTGSGLKAFEKLATYALSANVRVDPEVVEVK